MDDRNINSSRVKHNEGTIVRGDQGIRMLGQQLSKGTCSEKEAILQEMNSAAGFSGSLTVLMADFTHKNLFRLIAA
jgi:hypothetical protein